MCDFRTGWAVDPHHLGWPLRRGTSFACTGTLGRTATEAATGQHSRAPVDDADDWNGKTPKEASEPSESATPAPTDEPSETPLTGNPDRGGSSGVLPNTGLGRFALVGLIGGLATVIGGSVLLMRRRWGH